MIKWWIGYINDNLVTLDFEKEKKWIRKQVAYKKYFFSQKTNSQ